MSPEQGARYVRLLKTQVLLTEQRLHITRMSDSPADEDVSAMSRLRDGDDLTLNELMARGQEPSVRFLYRYTVNEPDALHLAQETLVRVYEHRGSYDARGMSSRRLYTIAGNLCRNHARWKTRHPTVSMDLGTSADSDRTLGEQIPDGGPMLSDDAVTHERVDAVRDAIQEPSDEQLTATILHEYEDVTYAANAKIQDCSVKVVETRLYRARQTLRERLGRWLK